MTHIDVQHAIIVPMGPSIDKLQITIHGETAKTLPRFSGVYRFYDSNNALLYIGKSIDIRTRVQSHMQEGRKPGRHQRIMTQVARIDCTATAGEVGALLAENAAIKAETPMYNRRQRQVRKLWTIQLKQSANGFLIPASADFIPESERISDSYGLYHNPKHVDSTLRRHARDHGLCLRMLGMDKGRGPCFQFQLRRCDGACAGQESAEQHNARLLSVLDRDRIAAWPFAGPLALCEHNSHPIDGQPTVQYHVVDHWSYLGSVTEPTAARATLLQAGQRFFDRDAYHLLMSAMRKGRVTLIDVYSGNRIDNPLLQPSQALA